MPPGVIITLLGWIAVHDLALVCMVEPFQNLNRYRRPGHRRPPSDESFSEGFPSMNSITRNVRPQ